MSKCQQRDSLLLLRSLSCGPRYNPQGHRRLRAIDRPTFHLFALSLPACLPACALPSASRGLPASVVTATALCCSPAQTSRRRDANTDSRAVRRLPPTEVSSLPSEQPSALPYRRHCNPPRCATLAHSVCLQDRASVTVTMRQRKFSFDLPRLVCRRRCRPPYFSAY